MGEVTKPTFNSNTTTNMADTPKFLSAVFDHDGIAIAGYTKGNTTYSDASARGFQDYVEFAKSPAALERNPQWDVYKRVGRSSPNKPWAVTLVNEDLELKTMIVPNCVDWHEALVTAFPNEQHDFNEDASYEDAQQVASANGYNFICTQIDELAL